MRECEEFKVYGMPGAYTLEDALQAMSTPPPAIAALNEVLGTSPIDLLQLGAVGRSYPAAAAQILKLCNSSIFCLQHPASSLEQAVVSLGAEVLRTLGLAWGLVELAGKYLPPVQAQAFWQHGLTLALFSERIAERIDYPVAEAYLAGFLHDIGRVPMLMTATPGKHGSATDFLNADESPEIEVRDFGIHHGELGYRIGVAWSFSEPFVEVFRRHHDCDEITEEIELVRIVSAAERFCSQQARGKDLFYGIHPGRSGRSGQLLTMCFPGLKMTKSMTLVEVLELEFLQSAQRLKLGTSKPLSPAVRG
jgi:HD-like signal output (HDOD) protein